MSQNGDKNPHYLSLKILYIHINVPQVVSDSLEKSDFKSLEGIVEKDAINSLKTAVSKLSVGQRQLLSIDKDDIFYAFPYQVRKCIPYLELY